MGSPFLSSRIGKTPPAFEDRYLVCLVCLVCFVNQMNQINKTNQFEHPALLNRQRHSSILHGISRVNPVSPSTSYTGVAAIASGSGSLVRNMPNRNKSAQIITQP